MIWVATSVRYCEDYASLRSNVVRRKQYATRLSIRSFIRIALLFIRSALSASLARSATIAHPLARSFAQAKVFFWMPQKQAFLYRSAGLRSGHNPAYNVFFHFGRGLDTLQKWRKMAQ